MDSLHSVSNNILQEELIENINHEEPEINGRKGYIDYSLSSILERYSIVVKHIPSELSEQTLKELFEHYGGGRTTEMKYWKARAVAFVKFQEPESAENALRALNRKRILDKTLIVEYAKDDQEKQRDKARKIITAHLEPDPIAPSLGIDYGPPPHLEYSYPPPNDHILHNIYNAISSVPKLYTQVLHLMNKMNLPPPFSGTLPVLADMEAVIPKQQKPKKRKKPKTESEDEESEIESDPEEENKELMLNEYIEQVRKKPKENPKENSLQEMGMPIETIPQPYYPPPSSNLGTSTPVVPRNIISFEELQSKRIPLKELLELPLFKDKPYDVGTPNPRLYIKNLYKDIQKTDLMFIFGRYFESDEVVQRDMKVDIMDGRMKGQAFVTFPSTEIAKLALEEVNGFKLHDKPMLIQFGKVETNKK